MKLTFLGTGSAFTVDSDNYQSNMLLENEEGKKLLLDCGSDVRRSLYDLRLSYRDIEGVFVSHLHSDHIGGLDWLAFGTYFTKLPKPILYVPSKLVDDLWRKVLEGVLDSIDEFKADLDTFFDVRVIKEDHSFEWSNIEFFLVPTVHISSNKIIKPSYGLIFTYKEYHYFITCDTQYTPEKLMSYYKKADIIFHDCETLYPSSGVHTPYHKLKELEPALREKMWLYHYNMGSLPDAKKDGFRGFIKKGQYFDLAKAGRGERLI